MTGMLDRMGTLWPVLDAELGGGMARGEFWGVAGLPGSYKTPLLVAMAFRMAQAGCRVHAVAVTPEAVTSLGHWLHRLGLPLTIATSWDCLKAPPSEVLLVDGLSWKTPWPGLRETTGQRLCLAAITTRRRMPGVGGRVDPLPELSVRLAGPSPRERILSVDVQHRRGRLGLQVRPDPEASFPEIER